MDPVSILGLVQQVAGVSFQLYQLFNAIQDAPKEFKTYSSKVKEFSETLMLVSEKIKSVEEPGSSVPSDLIQCAKQRLADCNNNLSEISTVLEGMCDKKSIGKGSQTIELRRNRIKWMMKKNDIRELFYHLDMRKNNLALTLDMVSFKQTSGNLEELRQQRQMNYEEEKRGQLRTIQLIDEIKNNQHQIASYQNSPKNGLIHTNVTAINTSPHSPVYTASSHPYIPPTKHTVSPTTDPDLSDSSSIYSRMTDFSDTDIALDTSSYSDDSDTSVYAPTTTDKYEHRYGSEYESGYEHNYDGGEDEYTDFEDMYDDGDEEPLIITAIAQRVWLSERKEKTVAIYDMGNVKFDLL